MTAAETIQTCCTVLGAVAAVLQTVQKKLVEKLTAEAAFSPETALVLSGLNRAQRVMLKRLLYTGSVALTEEGEYWLDQELYARWRAKRRKTAFTALAVIVTGILVWITFFD